LNSEQIIANLREKLRKNAESMLEQERLINILKDIRNELEKKLKNTPVNAGEISKVEYDFLLQENGNLK
jgi:hypothetical protein